MFYMLKVAPVTLLGPPWHFYYTGGNSAEYR